jgi:adenosylcobinamide-GDP ribazoletransferase
VSTAAVERPRPLLGGVRAALRFLTVLPVPGPASSSLSSAAPWFPAVGALVGALAGLVTWGAGQAAGMPVGATLGVTTLIVLTGGLHQDALADCADGLGMHAERERRHEVMADPRIGVFGALALILWIVLMITALARAEGAHAVGALTAAGALGRWAGLVHAFLTRPARSDGLGATFAVSRSALVWSSLLCTGLVFLSLGYALAAAAAASLTVAVASARWARRAVGGRTGDTVGAAIALAEVVVCLFASG